MEASHVLAPRTSARRSRLGPFGGRLNVAMVVANALGIGLFLWAASHAWASRLERAPGIPPEPGDAFVWFVDSAPVLAVFLLLNVGWVVITIARRQWRNAIPFVVVAGLWCVALVVDNLRH